MQLAQRVWSGRTVCHWFSDTVSLGQMASTARVEEEPPIRGERPDWTRCGRNDDIEAGVTDGHRPCRAAWVEPDGVYAADRRSPRGQAEAAGSHAVAVQRRDEVRTPPGNCRALHAAASVQIATATGEARACRLCGMADDPAGTTAGRQEASTFALSWSNSA